MKNFKVFLAGAIAVLIAMPAFAGVNVKMKGDFREYFSVFSHFPAAERADGSLVGSKKHKKDSDFRYSQRVRLSWIAEDDEKKVRGTFGIEVDTNAGQKTGTRNGAGGNFEGDRNNTEIWLAYIDFELPFDPATRVYMGLQDAGLNPFVFCDNAMGVRLTRSFNNVDVSLAWFRNDGDADYTAGGHGYGGAGKDFYDNLYALDVAWNITDANKLGFFVYFMDAGKDFGESLWSNDTINPMWWGDSTKGTQTYWIGLSGEFEQSGFFGSFNGIYQGGQAKATDDGKDHDILAWLFNAEFGYKFLEKAYAKIGYLYMSGDEGKTDINNYFGIDIDNTITGSVALLENLDWQGAFYGPNIGQYGAQHVYINVGYEFDEKNEGRIGFLWANADKKVHGARTVGYEFNAQWDHKLTKNLTWSFAGGYMIAGDAWERSSRDFGDGAKEGDDLWRIESRLRFKF